MPNLSEQEKPKMSLLEGIEFPSDLRKLKLEQLPLLAEELRTFLLEVISREGGHLGSNLGTVEITIALHYVFDTPNDRIVWDVGHQAYGHKVLTGRRERFRTIRQEHGLSGFTARSESLYDHFGAGHASTSISAALGIAEGLRRKEIPHFSIAVIGDGSLTGGLVYEAMNNAGHIPAKNLLVVFNDNNMSIDPNVGALRNFINKAVTHSGYNRVRQDLKKTLETLEETGIPVASFAGKVRKSLKNFFTPGMLFEAFGFRYLGPGNGHDVLALVDTFRSIKDQGCEGGPYLVHVLTTKGRGYSRAEEMPIKYHGVNPFDIEEGIQSSGKSDVKYQDVFADTMIRLAKEDPRVVAITAAMPSGTGLNKFQKELPGQFYDVGIAEGHAVLFAAGLATEGYKPVVGIYSTFLQRAYDQIIHDVGLQSLNVTFALDRAGPVGADGATHQGSLDLSYLRAVPNFVVMAPKDENELQHMLKTAVSYGGGPIAIRYPRGGVVGVAMDSELRVLPIGKGEVLESDGASVDVVIVAIGYAVQSARAALALLREQGVRGTLINARFVKPLDTELLAEWVEKCRLVVTVEENSVLGGLGSAILEWMSSQQILKDALVLGMPDRFMEHASQGSQRKLAQIDGPSIAASVFKRLQVKRSSLRSVKRRAADVILTH